MIERVDLAPGYSVSRLINGCWQLSSGHHVDSFDPQQVLKDLERLVDAGLTTFDCADIYTGVEALLGRLGARLRRRATTAPPIQIHTKLVPDLATLTTVTRRQVEAIIDRSLRRLAVDRLDLVQFSWWDYRVPRYVEVAGWLVDLQQRGKIRHLGTTNFDRQRLAELLAAGCPIAVHQVQYSLLDRRVESGLGQLCREHGIHLLCYGSLAGGFLSERWIGKARPEVPLANRSLMKYRLIIEEFGGWDLFQDLLRKLRQIAAKHDVGLANIATRWVLDRSQVAALLLGTRNAAHLENNLRVFSLRLDADDRAELDTVLRRARGPLGEPFGLERVLGGRHATLMKTDLNREAED